MPVSLVGKAFKAGLNFRAAKKKQREEREKAQKERGKRTQENLRRRKKYLKEDD